MHEAVVIGASAGGLRALGAILSRLPETFAMPIAIAQHIEPSSDGYIATYMDALSPLRVKDAEDKECLCAGRAYFAPAGYHLLIDSDKTFSLSVDDKVNFARPAIDVLFESAADAYGSALVGVVLTGANEDGAKGLRRIRRLGGLAIVQDPRTAEAKRMPEAAIATAGADRILTVDGIAALLIELGGWRDGARRNN
jgi:two-component system chemotaxis response regulator CheB